MLRKSLGSNATQVNGRNTSQRRKSLDVKSLSREDDENNKNSVNKRRYSLRSPASKHINSNTTDAGALTGLIESMADNSTFSIHSEGESVASRSNTPSRITSSRQSSLRMSNGSELIAEEESFEVAESAFGFAKSPGGSRRVTADMDDMQALLANLSDSNCSLELSTLSHVSANSLAQEPERGRGALGAATEVAEAAASGPATPNGRNRSRSPRGSARKSFGQPASAAGTSSVESSGPPEQQPGPLSGLEDSTWDALRALRAPSSSSAPGTPAATSVSCLSADPLLDFSGLLGGTSVDDSAHSTLRSKGKDQRHTRRDTADFTDMQGLLDDSALNESLQSGGSSALGFGKRNHARESVETASLEQLLLNVSGGSSCGGEADGSPSPARELRRETVDPFDYRRMLLEDASALRDTSAVAAEAFTPAEGAAVGRRETIDAGDLSSLLSFSVDAAFPATTQEATEEDKEVRDEKDGAMDLDLDFSEGASCFGPLTGRQSIESVGSIGTVALLQCVADTLHGLDNRSTGMRSSGALPHDTSAAASLASSFSLDLSALDALAQRGAQTPTSAAPPSQCSSAPSLLSFSIAASPRAARRETADVSDVLHFAQTLLDEQEDQEGGGASNGAEAESSAYLSSSRLSAHSQSFARTAASALAGGAEVAENERDDGCSDTGTVNAADLDLLNDSMSMSTNESVATIGTLDLLDRVESAMVQDHLLEQGAG